MSQADSVARSTRKSTSHLKRSATIIGACCGLILAVAVPVRAQSINDIIQMLIQPPPIDDRQQVQQPRRAPPSRKAVLPKGEDVLRAQQLLNRLGYDAGTEDGVFGGRTIRALNQFQREFALPITERLDGQSLATLSAVAARSAPSTVVPSPAPSAPPEFADVSVPSTAGPSTYGPSTPGFDCSKATLATEIAICGSEQLGLLDVELTRQYSSAITRLEPQQVEAFQHAQRQWLADRNACGVDTACIAASYEQRLGALQGPTTIAASPSTQTVAAGAYQPFDLTAYTATSADMRALRIDQIDGIPVFGSGASPDSLTFWRILAFSLDPETLNERLVWDILPEGAVRDSYLRQQRWIGDNEFQKEATRQRFLTAYGERLRRMAPTMPFRFYATEDLHLPRYDTAKAGFAMPSNNAGIGTSGSGLGVSITRSDDTPTMWKIAPEAADAELQRIAAEASSNSDTRRISYVILTEATAYDPASRRISFEQKDFALYNLARTRLIHRFTPEIAPQREAVLADLGYLVAPRPGIKPIDVSFLEGMPVLNEETTAHLFLLAKLGVDRDLLTGQECKYLGNLMTDDGLAPYIDKGCWRGQDEFQQAETRRAFLENALPSLRSFAPVVPFRFVLTWQAYVDTYDATNKEFTLRRSGTDPFEEQLRRAVGKSDNRYRAAMGFNWPEYVVKISEANAPKFISTITSWPHQSWGGSETGKRIVQIVAMMEVTGIDPSARRIDFKLRSMSLRDPSLTRKLYDFPLSGNFEAFVEGAIPKALEFSGPTPFDAVHALVMAIGQEGFDASEERVDLLSEALWKREATRYDTGFAPDDLSAEDARRPFFSRAGPSADPATREKLRQWSAAYLAAAPDLVEHTINISTSSADADSRHVIEARAGLSDGGLDNYVAAIESAGLQTDQVSLWNAADMPILIAMPNRQSLYAVEVDTSAIQPHLGKRIRKSALFRTDAPSAVVGEDGKPALLIRLDPVSVTLKSDIGEIVTRTFDDVPRLDDANFVAAGASERTPLTDARLDSGLIDLIVAANVGGELSPAAQAHLLARRWRLENDTQNAVGGRYFVLGKRMPTTEEATSLIPSFLDWARSSAPELPIRVPYRSELRLHSSAESPTIGWGRLACFGGPAEGYQGFGTTLDGEASDLSRKKMAEAGTQSWTIKDEARVLARRAGREVAGLVHPFADTCTAPNEKLGIENPSRSYVAFNNSMPAPDNKDVRAGRADAEPVIEISGVRLSDIEPHFADLLPADIKANFDPTPAQRASGEFVVLDAKMIEVTYYGAAGGAEIGRLAANEAHALGSVLERFATAYGALNDSAQHDGPYGLDMVGIQLGMSFAEAEATIRAHMKVGRVLEGKRPYDGSLDSGLIAPLTSGKLFVSADEREFIALIDEAPAAANRVLAAWRRIYIPAGMLPEAEAIAVLRNKYGEPKQRSISVGERTAWMTMAGNDCTGIYQYGQPPALSASWVEGGAPADFHLSDGQVMPDAIYPPPYLDPTNPEQTRYSSCGPFLTSQLRFDASRSARAGYQTLSMDSIEQTLTDIGPYLDAFAESRRQLAEALASGGAGDAADPYAEPTGPDMVGVRIGMDFQDADAAIRNHMDVQNVFEASGAAHAGAHFTSGRLYLSAAGEAVAIFDDPDFVDDRVIAAWRRLYVPAATTVDAVAGLLAHKYGDPSKRDDRSGTMLWQDSADERCLAVLPSALDAGERLSRLWVDGDDKPLSWVAPNGDGYPAAPRLAATVSGSAGLARCDAAIVARTSAVDGAMAMIETILTDQSRMLNAVRSTKKGSASAGNAVKF